MILMDFGGFPVHRSYQERITYIAPRIQCFCFQPVAMLLTFTVAQVASHGAAGSLGRLHTHIHRLQMLSISLETS